MRLIRIWLYTTALISSVCVCMDVDNTMATSTLRSPAERVFSRRKRWLLLPKGAALKFTVSVSKRLLALYPRGFNFNLEAAVYYPMPSTRIDLIPKRFRKPTTKAPKANGPTPLNLINIPGSLIKYRAKPATRPPLVQRIDHNATSFHLVPNSQKTESFDKWKKYTSPKYLHKYEWFPEGQHKYANTLEYNKYWNSEGGKWRTRYNSSSPWQRYSRGIRHFESDSHELRYDNVAYFTDSPQYHAYRSRRDLLNSFEGFSHVIGIDMKSCVLRAMCDSKRFLLPQGYSMIQDILRVVLTLPSIYGLKDEYSLLMGTSYETCDAFLHQKCPFSILEWFLNPKKRNK